MVDTASRDLPSLSKAAEVLQAVARPLISFITCALPHVINLTQKANEFYKKLPIDVVTFLVGCIFCFFGGVYPVLFAAIQAAKHSGIMTVKAALGDLAEEAQVILEASKKDDKVDEDKDGKADVEEIDGKALLRRKANLVMTKMNPAKVDAAIGSVYKVWLSVLAVLTIQFARTISLALSISDFLKRPIDHVIAPTLQSATPTEYKKWVPVILGWITKSIAMSIAWYIQTVISAFTSALEGGLIMSRSLLKIFVKRGMNLGGLIPEKDEDTYFDEIASYVFAALGLYFQFKLGFDIPFPFNIPLLPFEFAETYIRWTITKVS